MLKLHAFYLCFTLFLFFRTDVFVLRNASKYDLAGREEASEYAYLNTICSKHIHVVHVLQSGCMVRISAWNRNQNVCYLSINVCTLWLYRSILFIQIVMSCSIIIVHVRTLLACFRRIYLFSFNELRCIFKIYKLVVQ